MNAALDSFISPIPGFNGEMSILAIPVSTQPPDDESSSDPSARALRTWVGKQKATTNPTPSKKTRKVKDQPSGGIKINEPMSKAPALTPPFGPRKGFLIHRSNCILVSKILHY
jgi:hypothetical protein